MTMAQHNISDNIEKEQHNYAITTAMLTKVSTIAATITPRLVIMTRKTPTQLQRQQQ